jgi:hypothetical protein
VKEYQPVSTADLDRVSAEFPEEARVPGFVSLMVEVDARWDRIKQIKAAGWKTPPGNPDLAPAHEARLLREAFAEAARLPEVKHHPEEFREWLGDAEKGARRLEEVLIESKRSGAVNAAGPEEVFKSAGAACTRCHAKYRNVPAK